MRPEELLGTRLRHVLDRLDGGIADVYRDLGLPGFRPRYAPILRVLDEAGPRSIRDLAAATSVTHSAASQTVAQLAREGYVELLPGTDARQRIVHLTPKATAALPVLDREWHATKAAAGELDGELPVTLHEMITAIGDALDRRSFQQRVTDHLPPA
jgi:DNA-binding MarR family transcriptional regulator